MVAPARAGFQKFVAAHPARLPTDRKKRWIAPMTFTSGELGSNSLAITKNPTRIQSSASFTHPQGLMPSSRNKTCRLVLGRLPVRAAVSPIVSSAGSVTGLGDLFDDFDLMRIRDRDALLIKGLFHLFG